MDRKATAQWSGTLKDGQGQVSAESGAFHHVSYSAHSRFKQGGNAESQSTNPEELIAAAHAACFSMAITNTFEKANFTPRSIDVTASVSLKKDGESWNIPSVHLMLRADVPDMAEGVFRDLAEEAKEKCPVSRLLKANISMDAQLTSAADETQFSTTEVGPMTFDPVFPRELAAPKVKDTIAP